MVTLSFFNWIIQDLGRRFWLWLALLVSVTNWAPMITDTHLPKHSLIHRPLSFCYLWRVGGQCVCLCLYLRWSGLGLTIPVLRLTGKLLLLLLSRGCGRLGKTDDRRSLGTFMEGPSGCLFFRVIITLIKIWYGFILWHRHEISRFRFTGWRVGNFLRWLSRRFIGLFVFRSFRTWYHPLVEMTFEAVLLDALVEIWCILEFHLSTEY